MSNTVIVLHFEERVHKLSKLLKRNNLVVDRFYSF